MTPPLFASPGTQHQACPSSRQGDVASQPHLSRQEWGRPALRPNHPGRKKTKKQLPTSPQASSPLCPRRGLTVALSQPTQASFRGDGRSSGAPQKPCVKAPVPTPPKRRNSMLWSETLDVHQKGTFSTKEIKRQEVRMSGETSHWSLAGLAVRGADSSTRAHTTGIGIVPVSVSMHPRRFEWALK